MPITLTTYYHGEDIPVLTGENTFHSKELFQIYEATPGYTPLLIVAFEGEQPVARLLAAIRKTKKWLPACLAKLCMVYGTGELLCGRLEKRKEEDIFGEMLTHLVQRASHICWAFEFRNLDNSMFAYRYFRQNDFFPVNWLRVRNSLHNINKVEERFSSSRIRQVKKGLRNGAQVGEIHSLDEIDEFSRMLHRIYSARIRRYFPDREFFTHLNRLFLGSGLCKIFVVKYKGKIIGGSVCIYSGDNAYLWFSGGMCKTYASQSPGVLAVWKALEYAHQHGYKHLEFIDVGLPFRKHGYRTFVLRFGGKQSSTRRWFRVNWRWLNRLLVRFYV